MPTTTFRGWRSYLDKYPPNWQILVMLGGIFDLLRAGQFTKPEEIPSAIELFPFLEAPKKRTERRDDAKKAKTRSRNRRTEKMYEEEKRDEEQRLEAQEAEGE